MKLKLYPKSLYSYTERTILRDCSLYILTFLVRLVLRPCLCCGRLVSFFDLRDGGFLAECYYCYCFAEVGA